MDDTHASVVTQDHIPVASATQQLRESHPIQLKCLLQGSLTRDSHCHHISIIEVFCFNIHSSIAYATSIRQSVKYDDSTNHLVLLISKREGERERKRRRRGTEKGWWIEQERGKKPRNTEKEINQPANQPWHLDQYPIILIVSYCCSGCISDYIV